MHPERPKTVDQSATAGSTNEGAAIRKDWEHAEGHDTHGILERHMNLTSASRRSFLRSITGAVLPVVLADTEHIENIGAEVMR